MIKRTSRHNATRVIAAMAATVLMLAACGDDDETSSASSADSATADSSAVDTVAQETAPETAAPETTAAGTAAPETAAPATAAAEPGEPFVVGAIGTYSGPIALVGAEAGVKAWADSVNAAGGINGHPIELLTRDDSGDPALALTHAKELVEEQGIIALVGQASAPAPAIAEYLDAQGIPVIGGLDTGVLFDSDPNWLSVGGSYKYIANQVIELVKERGATKVGVVACIEAPTCAETLKNYEDIIAQAGLEMVYSELIPLSAPDYTAQCLAADAAGAETLITSLTPAAQINVYESCDQQGLDLLKIGIGSSVSTDFLEVPALDGYIGAHIVFPFHESSTPATEEFQKVIAEYAPDATSGGTAVSAFVAMTYASGKMFEAAVIAGDLGDGATAADVKAAMYKIPAGETLGGLVPPLTYVDGEPTVVPCFYIQEISGGAFLSPNGLDPVCLEI